MSIEFQRMYKYGGKYTIWVNIYQFCIWVDIYPIFIHKSKYLVNMLYVGRYLPIHGNIVDFYPYTIWVNIYTINMCMGNTWVYHYPSIIHTWFTQVYIIIGYIITQFVQ